MLKLTSQGGDGAYLSETSLRLGEIYCFTTNTKQLSLELGIPQRWYGMVEAYLLNGKQGKNQIIIQKLPDNSPTIKLSLPELRSLIDDDRLHLKHFPSNPLNSPHKTLNHMLITTQEHSLLIAQEPDLLSEWKLLCLYESSEKRVKLTYEWLTAQSDWFDIDPLEIDWILLAYQLLDCVNAPNDDDYDEEGGSFPIQT